MYVIGVAATMVLVVRLVYSTGHDPDLCPINSVAVVRQPCNPLEPLNHPIKVLPGWITDPSRVRLGGRLNELLQYDTKELLSID
jgi:hypothetical protein